MSGRDTKKPEGVDFVEPSDELLAVTRRWIKAVATKDAQILNALFLNSEVVRYVGSDADEIFKGRLLHEGYAQHCLEEPHFTANCAELEAFVRNEVGWAIWLGDLHYIERDVRQPYRISLIFTLDSGIWKIVHVHVSTPRSNVEIMGYEHSALQRLMETAKAEGEFVGFEGTSTIMFTDVANSTSLAAYMGDRAWSRTIGRHFDVVRKIIEGLGGIVVKTLGDGTMSGFPSARSAMQAALAIQQGVQEESSEPTLQVRIGLHTGDVVETEGDFFGSVVNKAARIAAIAEPGWILVSEAARSMAEEGAAFYFEEPQIVNLHGIAGESLVSRLLEAD